MPTTVTISTVKLWEACAVVATALIAVWICRKVIKMANRS